MDYLGLAVLIVGLSFIANVEKIADAFKDECKAPVVQEVVDDEH